MQTFGVDNIKSPTNRNRDTLFWGFGATRTSKNRTEPVRTDPKRSAVKVETIEITCSKETLGQSNHFKLKTSEK